MKLHIIRCVLFLLFLLLGGFSFSIQAQEKTPSTPQESKKEEKPSAEASSDPGKPTPEAEQKTPEQLKAEAEAKKKAEEEKKKKEEEKKKAQQLQKINKLEFDRRPSAILKAWSTPEEKKSEGEGESAAGEEEARREASPEKEKPEGTASAAESAMASIRSKMQLPPGVELPEGMQLPDGFVLSGGEGSGPSSASPPDPFDDELKGLQRNVTLGEWGSVKEFIQGLEEDLGQALHARMLKSLSTEKKAGGPGRAGIVVMGGAQRGRMHAEKNVFSFEDVLSLAGAAPGELDKAGIANLGKIVGLALEGGNVIEAFSRRLSAEVEKPEEVAVLTKREAAALLFASGNEIAAGAFLPDLAEAESDADHEAMNFLSRYYLALHLKEKKVVHLERAWDVTQAILASIEIEKDAKEEALRRAVDLAPKIQEASGEAWLHESFTDRPDRGMEILAAIGSSASTGLQKMPRRPDDRLKGLRLQTTAVEALLEAAPELARDWRGSLRLLSGNWLKEAMFSYKEDTLTSLGPTMQRDPFGNLFFINQRRGGQRPPNRPQPISTADLLEIKPSEAWLDLIDASARPKFSMVYAQLYLKVNEEGRAFPYIEDLARSHPEKAKDLVDEFLRVWTRNHDPNASRNNTNPYMFVYGFERKAESIPLTRSKQERNLRELAGWVERLRALPIEEPNEELLVRAFTTSHSSAEVYRLGAIESVFGSIDILKPKTLAEMVQKMRENLVGVWRQPATQKQKGTKRKQKDIEAEVLRGYEVAQRVIREGIAKHPSDWALHLAKASVGHDENNYRREVARDSKFVERREEAFAGFQEAARLYSEVVAELPEEEQSTKVYELWFYVSLGACDLRHVDHEKQSDPRQPGLIRQAIDALPGEASERHRSRFANALFTRMSSVNPTIKFRYLQAGFEIVGDHKQAREARKVFDYYQDLVTEIKLEAVIDGTDVVGHENPFGVFVNLRHTREIERESGGFGRYLQNQNNANFSYNYGRPTENYRDKFEEAAEEALREHFDVLSVTFQSEDVHSRAVEEYGWRVTPYAYLLLKPRGPEVDKIPSLKIDLDFLDTSGYSILPVESPAVPIVCSSPTESRPLANLEIVQTLDERQADQGKLLLEVKATANGLIPDLDEVVDVDSEGFSVASVEELGLSVSRFDEESEEIAVISERGWVVTMISSEGAEKRPETFTFAEPRVEGAGSVYQRYVDADIATVTRQVSLDQDYGEPSYAIVWKLAGALVVLGFSIYGIRRWRSRSRKTGPVGLDVPENITPFTILGFLRQIERENGFDAPQRQELGESIQRIENYYFGRGGGGELDLKAIAEEWMKKLRGGDVVVRA